MSRETVSDRVLVSGKDITWWKRPGAQTPYSLTEFSVPNAESGHSHWSRPRFPGRKVLRQQARRRGEFRRGGRR